MAITAEMLTRAGIALTPERFEALVLEAVSQLPALEPALDAAHELPAHEVAALRRGGFDLAPIPAGESSALARTAATYAALLATSRTVAETAATLGVDTSRVRQRLAARTLYGIKLRDGWQLPAWQFVDGGLVPGIDRVLPALDPALHPVAVLRWFTTPTADLDTDGVPLSPRDWLRAGNDPGVVAEIAAAL